MEFSELAERYMAENRQKYTASSLKTVRVVAGLAGRTWAGRDVSTLTGEDVVNLVTSGDDPSANTVVRRRNILRTIWRWAAGKRLVKEDIVAGLAMPRCTEGQRTALTREDCRLLLDACDGIDGRAYQRLSLPGSAYCRAYVAVAMFAGLRLAELHALEWSDIDLKRGTLTITNKSSFRTKSGKNRVVGIPPQLAAFLEAHRDDLARRLALAVDRSARYARATKCRDSEAADRMSLEAQRASRFVFPAPNGLSRESVPDAVLSILNGTEFSCGHVTMHCLRHTFATLAGEAGVNMFVLRDLMGHADVATTERYAHVVAGSAVTVAGRIAV